MTLRQIYSLPADAPMIVFSRHGHSLANEIMEQDLLLDEVDRALHYNFPFPDHKIPLTNKGRREARQMGRTLYKLFPPDDPIDRFLVSPFKRTRQSIVEAKRMFRSYKPPTTVTPELAERSRGDLYGYSLKGLKDRDPDFLAQWQDAERGMSLVWPNGMTAAEFIDILHRFTHSTLFSLPGVTVVNSHSFAITCMEVVIEQPVWSEALRIYSSKRLKNCEVSIFARPSPDEPFIRLNTKGLI